MRTSPSLSALIEVLPEESRAVWRELERCASARPEAYPEFFEKDFNDETARSLNLRLLTDPAFRDELSSVRGLNGTLRNALLEMYCAASARCGWASFARLNAVRAQEDRAFIEFQNRTFDTYTGMKSAHSFIRTEEEAMGLRPEAFSYADFSGPKTLPEYLRLVEEVRKDSEFERFNYNVGQKMYSGAFWRRLRYLTGVTWGERWSELTPAAKRLCGLPEIREEKGTPARQPEPEIVSAAESPAQLRFFEKFLSGKLLSPSTVSHYRRSMDVLDDFLRDRADLFGVRSIYGATTVSGLDELRVAILSNDEFIGMNKRNHNMYSAALNKFVDFLSDGWVDAFPDAPEAVVPYLRVEDSADNLVVSQVLRAADWTCQRNPGHATFMTDAGHAYMEGCHLIPLRLQPKFAVSLHVWANVFCLCPTCRSQMFHGQHDDRRELFRELYDQRAERFRKVGIDQTREELVEMVIP